MLPGMRSRSVWMKGLWMQRGHANDRSGRLIRIKMGRGRRRSRSCINGVHHCVWTVMNRFNLESIEGGLSDAGWRPTDPRKEIIPANCVP
jgi:hypothetical protein